MVRDFHSDIFGEKVFIFSSEDNPKEVQKILDLIYVKQEDNQFGKERYAVYFLPGTYHSKIFPHVGFYTQISGLGYLPSETKIKHLDSLARWLGNNPDNHNACCNFWRGVENIEVDSDTVWAVSQATFFRRSKVNGTISFHDDGGWCSGGFTADCIFDEASDSGTQQQWFSRNNEYKYWNNSSWNMVLCGDLMTQPLQGMWPEKPYTVIESTEVIREKPFLVFDDENGFGVFVPAVKRNSAGVDWKTGKDSLEGTFISIDDFYVAKPGDNASKINSKLSAGKHIFFTPGIYELTEPVIVSNKNTVILGSGFATLIPVKGTEAMIIEDEDGIIVSGILFDAPQCGGKTKIPVPENLLLVGREKTDKKHNENPVVFSDIFFRIGGTKTTEPAKTKNCITINSANVTGDNFWIWRADHGDQVGWTLNEAENGIIVNGDNVTMYALMVEHFNKHETIWNGNGGKIFMYQCEIPYDVPSQEVWMSHNESVKGYSSITVADNVTDFYGTGIGVYLLNRAAPVTLENAIELPDSPGVKLEHVVGVMIAGYPGMNHLVNGKGPSFLRGFSKDILTEYCNGISK